MSAPRLWYYPIIDESNVLDYVSDYRGWISSQPRSIFGSVAASLEAVALFGSFSELAARFPDEHAAQRSIYSKWYKVWQVGDDPVCARAVAEARFWGAQHEDVIDISDPLSLHTDAENLWFERYNAIFIDPTLLKYFEVGVLDIAVARDCAANDLDPVIAQSLFVSAEVGDDASDE